MISCSKRYRFEFQRWGKDWQGKKYFKVEVTECNDMSEVTECIEMTNELYGDIVYPDAIAKYNHNFKKKTTDSWKRSKYNEDDWIYDDNHFFWGYAVFDYQNENIIAEGGLGFESCEHPMKSLSLKDTYFRKPGEIPDGYKWEWGEYDGWLQFRWGDGENAIEKVRARKLKEEENRKKREEQKRLKALEEANFEEATTEEISEHIVNNVIDELQEEYDMIADKELVKYNMDKYGW